ncbi:mogroside IE synthase-like isoform X2 [Diospyros lotus]|uniref:mogroside IE synthase-like isoform X2 n=1 Tax=Diospyros lotus TaxID=55363 RepID=UPI002252B874|nr:mogroside IE synthase-like isoform X2 [Diospyros lotus]
MPFLHSHKPLCCNSIGCGERVREEMGRETHILVLPFPLQGHINPMLQFSKHLASKGLKVSFITTTSVRNTIHLQLPSSVAIQYISDGYDDEKQAESLDDYLRRFQDVVSKTLADFIVQKQKADDPPKLLVYDSVMPWALEVAKGLGLGGASFFTQSCAVNAIYYHLNRGHFEVPLGGPAMLSLPEMPLLGIDDLPSFICDDGAYPALLRLVANMFSNFRDADWLLFNTFDKLEEQMVKWMMASQWPIKTIGPSIPSMGYDDQDYGLSLFSPSAEAACINWLDSKPTASVVYASFGSLACLSEAQMEELAWGLHNATAAAHFRFHFLWVVRASEEAKLPANFVDETSEIGLIVNWSPQLRVLAHPAVGCFMTHCGWNSTLEALALGVPMVAMPQWSDQATNAKYIADVWRVGLRLGADDKGVITRQEIGVRIKEVMEGERGIELRKNAMRWRELAREAVQEEGSSDSNIEEFVSGL